MVLFQLPSKVVNFTEAVPPDFASAKTFYIVMDVKLLPEELFGDADLTGRLRIYPPLGGIKFEFPLFGGINRQLPTEGSRLKKFQYAGKLSTCDLTIDGSVARLEFIVEKIDVLGAVIQNVIEFLPSSFAVPTTCAVSIDSINGTANGAKFTVQFQGAAPGGESFSVKEINPQVSEYLSVVMPVMFNLPRKIVSAHRYLAQSFLLESASTFSYEFRGERILNLCKALEALLPDNLIDDIDAMRKFLKRWGLTHEQVEVFASIKYLRRQLDSAHIAISPMTDEAHRAVASFVDVAEKGMQALIVTAVKKWVADRSLYVQGDVVTTEPAVIRHLKKLQNVQIPNDWA